MLALSTFCMLSLAQISVPPMEVQLKGGLGTLPEIQDSYENQYSYVAPTLYCEINWNITQHISLGAFASAGVYSTSNFKVKYFSGDASYGASHLLYGLKLRLSTGRAPKFRPFTELSYGKLEMDMEKDVYRISSSTSYIGWSLGLMIRAGSRWYIILPQINLRFRSNGFFFEPPSDHMFGSYAPFAEVCGGLSYNIGKKK